MSEFRTNVLARTLATAAQRLAEVSFEWNFKQIERTAVERLNDKIDKVKNEGRIESKLDALLKERDKIAEKLPLAQDYAIGNDSNSVRLEAIQAAIQGAYQIFENDGNADDVTAAELESFNSAVDDISERISNLYMLSHPDVVDGNIIMRLKNELDTLQSFTPEVGVVDADGVDPTTNDNRDMIAYLQELENKVTVGITVTQNSAYIARSFQYEVVQKVAEIDSKMADLTAVEAKSKLQEIENLKVENANFLKALSISFETQKAVTGSVLEGLTGKEPETGSILNIFT